MDDVYGMTKSVWLCSDIKKLNARKTVGREKLVETHCNSSNSTRRKVNRNKLHVFCLPDFIDLSVDKIREFLFTYPTNRAGYMLGHIPVAWLRSKQEGMFVAGVFLAAEEVYIGHIHCLWVSLFSDFSL